MVSSVKDNKQPEEPRIIVDADSCPKNVLQICKALASAKNASLVTVANHNHSIDSDYHITVGDAPQQADIRILNIVKNDDVVITQDMGLAAMVMPKGAICLNPTGKQFRSENIDAMLEIRDAKAKFRRAGGRTAGPTKRTEEDDKKFENALRRILEDSNQ